MLSTCSAHSVVPLSNAFGYLTGNHICSDDVRAHPHVNSPERRVYPSPLLCLPNSRDKLVPLLGGQKGGGKEDEERN